MIDQRFIEKFRDWLNIPNDEDLDMDYEPPTPDKIGLKPDAPETAVKAYEEFKIRYREAKERGERI